MGYATTLVIGAGQSGLAMNKHLTDRSIDHVLLERGEVAHSQFSGSLANNCALADLKMNRLLASIDAWVRESGQDNWLRSEGERLRWAGSLPPQPPAHSSVPTIWRGCRLAGTSPQHLGLDHAAGPSSTARARHATWPRPLPPSRRADRRRACQKNLENQRDYSLLHGAP